MSKETKSEISFIITFILTFICTSILGFWAFSFLNLLSAVRGLQGLSGKGDIEASEKTMVCALYSLVSVVGKKFCLRLKRSQVVCFYKWLLVNDLISRWLVGKGSIFLQRQITLGVMILEIGPLRTCSLALWWKEQGSEEGNHRWSLFLYMLQFVNHAGPCLSFWWGLGSLDSPEPFIHPCRASYCSTISTRSLLPPPKIQPAFKCKPQWWNSVTQKDKL